MIAEHKAACPGHVWRRVHCKNLYQISEAAGDSAVNLSGWELWGTSDLLAAPLALPLELQVQAQQLSRQPEC